MEKGDRKRPLETVDGSATTATPPAYGSQEYWEERYKKLQRHDAIENKQENGEEGNEKEPDPFHAWYFTYEELAPLIVPLIVGDLPSKDASVDPHNHDDENPHIAMNKKPSEEGDLQAASPKQVENNALTGNENTNGTDSHTEKDERENAVAEEDDNDTGDDDDDDDQVDSDEYEDEDGDGDENENENEEEAEDDSSPARVGLAKHGPIEILEVGCGDVPLGNDIIHGIKELEQSEGIIVADKILKSVTCIDYSKTVIDAMKSKQNSEGGMATPSIPLEYACEDARKLPYPDERFHFILEKGTMDAMLSDSDKGSDNCRSIVAEMARVLARGGAIMIVSHINAHTENGINWLNEIVVPGLRAGAGKSHWNVEVHGGDVPDIDCEGEDDDESVDAGPAVYIMHKEVEKDDTKPLPPTVPLRFFSY